MLFVEAPLKQKVEKKKCDGEKVEIQNQLRNQVAVNICHEIWAIYAIKDKVHNYQWASSRWQILNIYAYNNKNLKHVKQKVIELQGETDKSTVHRNYNNTYLLVNSTNKTLVAP